MLFLNRSWSLELRVCIFSPALAIVKTLNIFSFLARGTMVMGDFPGGTTKMVWQPWIPFPNNVLRQA
jgi:hypothetical protein